MIQFHSDVQVSLALTRDLYAALHYLYVIRLALNFK